VKALVVDQLQVVVPVDVILVIEVVGQLVEGGVVVTDVRRVLLSALPTITWWVG